MLTDPRSRGEQQIQPRPTISRTFVLAVLVLAVTLQAGRPVLAEPGVLQIYNWADYVPPGLIEGFEAEFGVDVVYNTFDSEEIAGTRMMSGRTGYDLIGMSNWNFHYRYPLELYLPLDKDQLSNWKNLDPRIMTQLDEADPGNRYFAPFFWGTAGFGYNVDAISARLSDAPVHSLAMLFDPEVVRHFRDCGVAFLDDQSQALTLAQLYAGYGANDKSREALDAAEAVIRAVRPYIRYFENGRVPIDLPTGEVCLSMAWNGDFALGRQRARDDGLPINLAYTLGEEGSNLWIDGWIIPKDAPNPALAHQFLNYLMRPDVIAAASGEARYANAVPASRDFMDRELADDPVIFPTDAMMQRLEVQTSRNQKERRLVSRAWNRIKADFK